MGQSISEYRQQVVNVIVTQNETKTQPPPKKDASKEPAGKALKPLTPEQGSAVKQQLDFLVNAANLKLDSWQHEMNAMFSDAASVQKKQVPGIRALRWMRGYRVGVSSEGATDKIGAIVEGMFADKDEVDLLKALKAGTSQSMEEILSNTHAGEQSEEKFFVFMKNNAVLRLDIRVWRYNFEGENVMANKENVFCYIGCLSVVDHRKLELSELVYLVSEYSLNQDHVRKYASDLAELWVKLDGLKAGPLSLTGEAQPASGHLQPPLGQYGHQGRYSPQPSPRIAYSELQPAY